MTGFYFGHSVYLPLQYLHTQLVLSLFHMHGIWKEENLLLFKELAQDHFYY